MKTFIKKLTLILCFKMEKGGVKFIDIKSVIFKTILQKRTGPTCKARLQFSPLTYRSSLLTVQCFPPIILCFQNGDVCKSSEPIFTFVQRKNYMFMSKKWKYYKTIYRYCFSLNGMCN